MLTKYVWQRDDNSNLTVNLKVFIASLRHSQFTFFVKNNNLMFWSFVRQKDSGHSHLQGQNGYFY